jgi:prevent-host-death family protein
MSEVASRDLRNETASVLKRVQGGEDVVITVNGKPVARLVPVQPVRRRWLPRAELVGRLRVAQADAGLRADLGRLAGETTDDLGDVR